LLLRRPLLLLGLLLTWNTGRRPWRRIAENGTELGNGLGCRQAQEGRARCRSNQPGNMLSHRYDGHQGPGIGNSARPSDHCRSRLTCRMRRRKGDPADLPQSTGPQAACRARRHPAF
jgi:hypothetical protein